MTNRGMVIVGAGEAGVRAAVELRNQGWSGEIILIGSEEAVPYERPPLSKQVLTEADVDGRTTLPKVILDEPAMERHRIRFIRGKSAVSMDRKDHTVKLSDNQTISYERLLLATGANPRKLMLEGSDLSQVLYLRQYADALAIRSRLQSGRHIVVIGGGFIGLEVAASARSMGCDVTLLEAAPRILMRGVPEELAKIIEARHRSAGVKFKIGVGIARLENTSHSHVITLIDGDTIRCDMLIIGIGAVPETTLAAQSGLDIENGIKADERLATSDPDIFTAGDCCSFPHVLYDGRRIRLEAYRNAQDQGAHAAQSMLGGSSTYAEVPWFWSDQFDLTLQVTGLTDSGSITVRRDIGEGNHLYVHFTTEGRLVAASGIGHMIPKEIRVAQMLIEQRVILHPNEVMDPAVKLKSFLQKGD